MVDTKYISRSFPKNSYIVRYSYDRCQKDNRCSRTIDFVNRELQKSQPDVPQLVQIFAELGKNQPISFTINKEKRHIYVFTRPTEHHSQIEVYEYDDSSYKPIDKVEVDHPYYKTAFGDYDEENKKVLLGVVGFSPNESNFFREYIIGIKYTNIPR